MSTSQWAGLIAVGAIGAFTSVDAHACYASGVQVGAGVSANIALGPKPRGGRTSIAGHLFVEGSVQCQGLLAIVPGIELGLRGVRGEKLRGHALARVGPGLVAGEYSPGHINLVTPRIGGGLGFGGGGTSTVLMADLRLTAAHVRLLDETLLRSDRRGFSRTFLSIGAEGGFVPSYASRVVDGRPLRDEGRHARPRVATSGHPSARAAAWLERASDELEAVAAFVNLAEELESLGAPACLIRRCRSAARDEAAHVRLCLARAQAHGAQRVHRAPLGFHPRRFASRAEGIRILGRESYEDGFLNEGRAAIELLHEAQTADGSPDPDRRADAPVLRRIAREEQGHARLGLDLARWGLAA